MVGMLQILTYLLCVYLVFKGFEIFQIAYVSTSENRKNGLRIGAVFIVLGLIFAIAFSIWADSQAESISKSMQTLQQSLSPR